LQKPHTDINSDLFGSKQRCADWWLAAWHQSTARVIREQTAPLQAKHTWSFVEKNMEIHCLTVMIFMYCLNITN